MSKDQEGNGFANYNFKDSISRYRDKQHASDVERQVQDDKVRKAEQDEQTAKDDTRNVEEDAQHLQLIQEKMAAVLLKKKSTRAASTKDPTTTTQLEYMRACLCRI